MLRWVLGRAATVILTVAALSVVIFVATDLLPGDAAARMAGPDATPAQVAQLRTELGLDRPVGERLTDWLVGALRGDLGVSRVSGTPVSTVIADRLPASAVLVSLALMVSVPLGLVVGLVAGIRAGGVIDRTATVFAVVTVAVPEFVMTVLLSAIFSHWLGWFPAVSLVPLGGDPWDAPRGMVLPVVTLAVLGFALISRLTRAAAAQIRDEPYVEAARLRGIEGWALARGHILPNAVQSSIQAVAALFAGMIGGSVVVELVFNYPGIGLELRQAVAHQDIVMVQGITLVLSTIALASLLAADLVSALVDPRGAR